MAETFCRIMAFLTCREISSLPKDIVARTRPVAATDGGALARAIFFGPRGGDPLWRRGVGRWQMYCRVCGQIFTRDGSCTNEFDPKRASSPRTQPMPMGAESRTYRRSHLIGAPGIDDAASADRSYVRFLHRQDIETRSILSLQTPISDVLAQRSCGYA